MRLFALYSEFHAHSDVATTYNHQPRLSTKEMHVNKNGRKLQWYHKSSYVWRQSLMWRQSSVSICLSSYLSWCLHFATISDLLFRMSLPSCSAIANFSVRQSAHLRAWGMYALLLCRICHVTAGVPPASLILQTSSDSLLSVFFPGLLNACLCSRAFLLFLCRFASHTLEDPSWRSPRT